MPHLVKSSPTGRYRLELTYLGEVHFGPAYFEVESVGFDLELSVTPITDDVYWSASEKYMALIKIESGRRSRLYIVDLSTQEAIEIDSANGMITINSLTDDGEISYCVRESGNKQVREKKV